MQLSETRREEHRDAGWQMEQQSDLKAKAQEEENPMTLYLLQVWYGQQLLQPAHKLRHQLLQPLVIAGAVVCRKNLLQRETKELFRFRLSTHHCRKWLVWIFKTHGFVTHLEE